MRTPLILASLVLAGACAPTASSMDSPRAPRQCFFVSEVRSFASADPGYVYVRTGRDEVFELRTMGCSNVDVSRQIGVAARGGGTTVCSGLDAELIVPELGMGQRTCPVTSVRRLTDEEIAALDEDAVP